MSRQFSGRLPSSLPGCRLYTHLNTVQMSPTPPFDLSYSTKGRGDDVAAKEPPAVCAPFVRIDRTASRMPVAKSCPGAVCLAAGMRLCPDVDLNNLAAPFKTTISLGTESSIRIFFIAQPLVRHLLPRRTDEALQHQNTDLGDLMDCQQALLDTKPTRVYVVLVSHHNMI